MADPKSFYGKDWTYGTPETKDQFRGMASPELWQMLGKFKSGASTDWPSASYDYLLKKERSEEDAKFMGWYMDNLRDSWGGGKGVAPTPLGLEQPGVEGNPATAGDANEMLIKLLGGN